MLTQRKVRVARYSIYSNSGLVGLKLVTGIAIGSISVLSEGIHSMIDLVAAVIANYSVKKSGQPADKEHPYGHGKYENYAGVIEAILILFAAGLIVYEAIGKLFDHTAPEFLLAGIIIMGISVIVNLYVSHMLLKVGREEDSMALIADGLHLRTDVLTSLGVFLGLILIQITQIAILDPIVAILVACLIVKAAWDLTKEASKGLIDQQLPPEEEAVIKTIMAKHCKMFIGYHALRTRKAGSERFIDMHLVVKKDISVHDAHQVCDTLEKEIESRLKNTNVLIHIEPCESEECPLLHEEHFVDIQIPPDKPC
ncbi:MAG: cation diffusion facilitator family transporter [Methanomassiliicoccales archaeon]|jgi:cation diffusion facilitator family transporter